MSLTKNNDIAIGFALIALGHSSSLMNEAMERLSTGKRINNASDDPARIHQVMRLNRDPRNRNRVKKCGRRTIFNRHFGNKLI